MADYLIYQHLYKYYLKFAVFLLCGGNFFVRYFVTLDLEVRRIMRILPDLAADPKSSLLMMSPHLAGVHVKVKTSITDGHICALY